MHTAGASRSREPDWTYEWGGAPTIVISGRRILGRPGCSRRRRKMRLRSLLVWALILVPGLPSRGAIAASGGMTKEYQSPLTLMLDFPLSDASRWGKGWASGADFAALPEHV